MRRTLRLAFLPLTLAAFAAFAAVQPVHSAESVPPTGAPERFEGRVVDSIGNLPRGSSAFFTLHVDRYTTDEELAGFLTILRDQGEHELRLALEKVEVGFVKIANSLGYPVAIAREHRTEKGRVLRFATARQIAMFESMRNTRSLDYPFGMLELVMPDDGKGEGQLAAAVSVEITPEKRLEMTSYAHAPYKVLQVRRKAAQKR